MHQVSVSSAKKQKTHIVAITGSYFRGDAEAVLAPHDEAKFDQAIAASLLVEQVLAPRFEFKPKNAESGPVPGFDYGDRGWTKCNVGFNRDTGQFQIEIKGLVEPKSKEGVTSAPPKGSFGNTHMPSPFRGGSDSVMRQRR